MADSAPSPSSPSSSSNGTSNESPSPPAPKNQTSPSSSNGTSKSSPPSSSPPSPPAPPPSESTTPDSPTSDSPSQAPPPEDDSSSAPPPSGSEAIPPSPDDSEASASPPQPSDASPPAPSQPSSPLPESPPPPPRPPPGSSNSSLPSTPPSPSIEQTPPPPSPVPQDPSSPPQPSPTDPQTPPAPDSSPPIPTSPPRSHTPYHPPPSEVTPATPSGSTTPVSQTPTPARGESHHSRQSSSGSSKSSPSKASSSSNNNTAVTAGLVVGVIAVALLALCLVVRRKKRRQREDLIMNHYRPPQSTLSVKSDGYYNKSGPPRGSSVHSDSYYGAPHSSNLNSYGSQIGGAYGYQSGVMDSGGIGNSRSCFNYEELAEITNGFSRENVLGEGGFGCVYKGTLSDGREVAVKQLKAGSGQGEREFRAEVEIISRVHHRYLVSLVGYCIADYQRLLVYEFVPNGTLEDHLHAKAKPAIDWSKRVKIAIGSAKGLAYLHEDCHPRIIHRDIKSANILLDNSFEAQVADFGLAKLSNDTHTHVSTRVMGTFGYMAPEYASSGKLTDRSDVYSFGVVLLELVTGRKPVDASQPLGDESLVEWARPLLIQAMETGNLQELVDARLENNYDENEMMRMIEAAAACVRHSAPKRPRMAQVVRALDSEGELADLSNGVKYGQSTIFQSGQNPNADIERFRRMAFGSGEFSSEYGLSSEYGQGSSAYSSESREAPHRPLNPRSSDSTFR